MEWIFILMSAHMGRGSDRMPSPDPQSPHSPARGNYAKGEE